MNRLCVRAAEEGSEAWVWQCSVVQCRIVQYGTSVEQTWMMSATREWADQLPWW